MTSSVSPMFWRDRRRGARFVVLALALVLGAATLTMAPAAPAAPANPRSSGQPSIEAARLDLDALPAPSEASSRPAQVHRADQVVEPAPVPPLPGPEASDHTATSGSTEPTGSTVAEGSAPAESTTTSTTTTLPPAEAPVTESPECLCPGWSRRADLPIDGEMVNLIWEGSPDVGVQIRSNGPDGWSDWEDAHLDADESPDAGTEGADDDRHVLGPVWTGPGTDQIELYLESGEPRSLELEVLHSVVPEGWDPGAPSPAPASALGAPFVSSPSAGQPVIFNRSQWGAGPWRSDHAGCGGGPFYASELRFGVVHHTVSTNDYSPGQAFSLVQGVYYTHTNSNGWCDIGYNFLVDKYGQIFEGRSMSLYGPVIGGHAKGFNSASNGVALLGQYHPGASPPSAGVTGSQLESLANVMVWKFDQYGIDPHRQTLEVSGGSTSIPAGQWVWLNNVSGHRDVGATGCPGNNMYNLLPQLRNMIAAKSTGPPWTFRDVKPSHPFFHEIEWMVGSQLANGYSDGTFKPLSWVSRQAVMAFLYRFAASPGGPFPNPGYTDVATNHPFYKPIAWATKAKITTGYPDGRFQPTFWVSREGMAAFLYRLASSPPGPFPNPNFRDIPTNHEYYKEIAWAKANGVIKGYSDRTFRPGQPVTRQATASFMFYFADLF